ncbi:hypothetical protein LOZ43_002526 [Ophidiomyces ophidiicola]|nr:hypothetical protein LOZ43_002526 [Ophidiomyces ophidiicola]
MPLSPYRQSNTALRLSRPSEQRKLGLQEVKILLSQRRYKQCAALSLELRQTLEGNLHEIHKSYLHYYGAASYETMGRAAHKYSSNKLPLLKLARDGYVSCKTSLEGALKDLNVKHITDMCESEDTSDGIPFFEAEVENLRSVSDHLCPETPKRTFSVFDLTEPWRTYARLKNESTNNNIKVDMDENEKAAFKLVLKPPRMDNIRAIELCSESSTDDLMPPPLHIRKTREKARGLPKISIPDRSLLPLPLFSPPLSPPMAGDPKPPSRAPNPGPSTPRKFQSRIPIPIDAIELTPTKTKRHSPQVTENKVTIQPSICMLSILSSLPSQLETNINNIDILISQATEIQHVHKATKSNRLASFWSFDFKSNEAQPGCYNDGTRVISNGMETRQERILRLRSEGWNTVGIKNPERGWKGSEYYERICAEALSELYGN